MSIVNKFTSYTEKKSHIKSPGYSWYEMNYLIRMRNLREDNDFTQEYVARRLGTSQTMYARYERGANELPILPAKPTFRPA